MTENHIIFPSEADLQEASQRNVKCNVAGCDKHFSTLPALWMHSAKTHRIYKDKLHEEAFTTNRRRTCLPVMKQYVCPVKGCKRNEGRGKPFDRLSQLKTHYINIHAEKKYPCERCGSRFGSASYLNMHISRCGQMFHCSCGVPFTTPEALYMHSKRKMHELSNEFKNNRKYQWRRKDLEAEMHGEPLKKARKQRPEVVPILPKGATFIVLQQSETPKKVTVSTQTCDKETTMTNPSDIGIFSKRTVKKKGSQAGKRRKVTCQDVRQKDLGCILNTPCTPLPICTSIRARFATDQLQRLADSRDIRLAIQSSQQNKMTPNVQTATNSLNVAHHSQFPLYPGDTSSGNVSSLAVSTELIIPTASRCLYSSSPITVVSDVLPSQNIQIPSNSFHGLCVDSNEDNYASVAVAQESLCRPSQVSIDISSNPQSTSSMTTSNTVLYTCHDDDEISVPCEEQVTNTDILQSTAGLPSMSTSNVSNGHNALHNTIDCSTLQRSMSNSDVNLHSIDATLETLGVPTQTDSSFFDLLASCNIQTQTNESIFHCSPILRETSATQTQEQTNCSVGTNPQSSTSVETLVNDMLQACQSQVSMQTQTLSAEQNTMHTQTPTNASVRLGNVDLEIATHSTIATSPCSQLTLSLQQETQQTQTVNDLSSSDLLLDIYTQTVLSDMDGLGESPDIVDLEFSTIHTQTMDDFDLGMFGIDGHSASAQTDFPFESNGCGITVGTQVHSQFIERSTTSTSVHTETSGLSHIVFHDSTLPS